MPPEQRCATITAAELVPGKTLPAHHLTGVVKMVWPATDEHHLPRLKVELNTKLSIESDYMSAPVERPFSVRFTLRPTDPSPGADVANHVAECHRMFARSLKTECTIDCAGAVVTSRTVGDRKNDKIVVEIEGNGPRRAIIQGKQRVLLELPRDRSKANGKRKEDWFFDSPSPANVRSAPSPMVGSAVAGPSTDCAPRAPVDAALLAAAREKRLPLSALQRQFTTKPSALTRKRSAASPPPVSSKRARPDSKEGQPSAAPAITGPPCGQKERVDLSSHTETRSTAPHAAVHQDLPHRFLPTPSDLASSRPDSIETPPSSSIDDASRGFISQAEQKAREIEEMQARERKRVQEDEAEGRRVVEAAAAREHDERERERETARRNEDAQREREGRILLQERLQHEEAQRRQREEELQSKRQEGRQRRELELRREREEQVRKVAMADRQPADEGERDDERINATTSVVPRTDKGKSVDPRERQEAARRQAEARAREAAAAKAKQQAEQQAATRDRLLGRLTVGETAYTPLRLLSNYDYAHVMGIVVRVMPIKTTSMDHTQSVVITDPSLAAEGMEEDFVVTIFRAGGAGLGVFAVNQVVAFRGLKISEFNGKLKGNAFSGTPNSWYILGGSSSAGAPPVTRPELERLKALQAWRAGDVGPDVPPPSAAAAASPLKDVRLGSVRPDQFFNAVVKILHIVEKDMRGGTRYELYVSDGTTQPTAVSLRNFHNIDAGIPANALWCLTVFESGAANTRPFEPGTVVRFPNVRAKLYRGEMELNWSEKVTEDQLRQGWKQRRLKAVPRDDPCAVAIEQRIEALRAQRKSGRPPTATTTTPTSAPSAPPTSPQPPRLATHIGTTKTDPASHPLTPLADAARNTTVPNRYRVRARVASVIARGAKGSLRGDLAVLWCAHCRHAFAGDYCRSCNDTGLKRACARWEMVVALEAEEGASRDKDTPAPASPFLVTLAGDEAARILPPLPQVHTGANEVRRARQRIPELTERAHDVLQGARMDGTRTRPLIDWTIESFIHGPPNGRRVVCWRIWGMRAAS